MFAKFPALILCALLVPAFAQEPKDEKLNSLLSGHDRAVKSAVVPLHRKLVAELEKLRATYLSANKKGELAAVDNELEKLKAEIDRLNSPETKANLSADVSGLALSKDLRILVGVGQAKYLSCDLANGTVKMQPAGAIAFTNTVKVNDAVSLAYMKVLEGDFEVELKFDGQVWTAGLEQYNLNREACAGLPFKIIGYQDTRQHRLVLRKFGNTIAMELDGQGMEVTRSPNFKTDGKFYFALGIQNDHTVQIRSIKVSKK